MRASNRQTPWPCSPESNNVNDWQSWAEEFDPLSPSNEPRLVRLWRQANRERQAEFSTSQIEEMLERDAWSLQANRARVPVALGGEDFSEYADLIPELDPITVSSTGEDLDAFLKGQPPLELYQSWIGKTVGKRVSRDEVMISCPLPGHPDAQPSASMNLDKGVWNCHRCGIGGDVYALGAIRFGYDLNSYQDVDKFPALKREMLASLGYVIAAPPVPAVAPVVEQDEEGNAEPDEGDREPERTDDDEDVQADPLAIQPYDDLLELCPSDTFLGEWMIGTEGMKVDPKYRLWTGMVALSAAINNNVRFRSMKGNLFVVLIGDTGVGKSSTITPMKRVIKDGTTIPPLETPEVPVKQGVSSGEKFIDMTVIKSDLPGEPNKPAPIVAEFAEFSDLAQKANRNGSTIKEALIDAYDGNSMGTASREHGDVFVEDPFVSLISSTQPRSMRRVMHEMDLESGFANRFIFVSGDPVYREKLFAGPTYDIGYATEKLAEVFDFYRDNDDPVQLEFDNPATEAYLEAMGDAHLRDHGTALGSSFSNINARLIPTVTKIMILFAANEHSTVITRDIVERTFRLVPWLLGAADEAQENISASLQQEQYDVIVEEVRLAWESGEPHTKSSLNRRLQSNRKWKAHEVTPVRKLAMESGEFVERVPQGQTKEVLIPKEYA